MRLMTKITIFIVIVMLGFCAIFIVLSSRNEIYSIENFDTSDVSDDNKTETKAEIEAEDIKNDKVVNITESTELLKKMDQSDFDRIMNNIISDKAKVSIKISHETNDILPNIDSKSYIPQLWIWKINIFDFST